jgi:hypothetical protein
VYLFTEDYRRCLVDHFLINTLAITNSFERARLQPWVYPKYDGL